MRERILRLVGERAGTSRRARSTRCARACCGATARRSASTRGSSIYDTDDQTALMKQVLREQDLPATGELRPAAMLGAISRWKNEMLDETFLAAERASTTASGSIATPTPSATGSGSRPAARSTSTTSCSRRSRLFERGAGGAGARYQERWRYLHVDEYQDTNRAQYLWVRALAAAHRNLRGRRRRRPDHLLLARRGPAQHPRLRARLPRRDRGQARAELPLDAAHPRRRARGRVAQRGAQGQEAVDREPARRAHRALRGGQRGRGGRVDRAPGRRRWSGRPGAARGSRRRADDDDDDPRTGRKDVAVMYRTNAQSRAIEEAFLRYGLRYQLVGGTRFYQRREVKDALAYLRVLRSDTDGVAFERIINVPARGIGEKTIEALRELAPARDGNVWRRSRPRPRARSRASRRAPGRRSAGSCALVTRLRAPGRRAAAARAARRGARGVGLPGDAHGRLAGGRGPLGEPARAARGRRPLRRPDARGRARPAARGDRARRRPGLVRGRARTP